MKPQFKHDCNSCVFIGNIFTNLVVSNVRVETDLYRSCEINGGYLLRMSNEDNDYITTTNVNKYLGVTLRA
jgi:hypothetical protein